MINNRDCFFYKKSDFINRLQDISPDSVCYIADTQQIYTHGRYFECNVTQDVVEQLIQNHGYLTAADLPVLTGGASPTPGEYVSGVSVGGHNVNVQKGKLSEINVGSASKLETPRKIELSGDLSGSIMFDGSQDVNIETIVHNSTTADRLTTPRTISLSSQATGQVSFDGSGNVDIPVTVNELDSKNSNNRDLNSLVTLNGYGGSLFYGIGGNTSVNKPSGVDWFGLFSFKSASGNYTTQILGSNNRLYSRSNADTSLGSWNTIAYLTDNVASATKLQNTRTFTISDGTNSGTASNFDGTGNVTLRLPRTINANIVGDITGDIIGDVTGDLHGNADTATKLQTGRNINGTLFDGTQNITTAQWGTARNIGIVNSDGTGTAVPISVNGSANVNLRLPATIKANLQGDVTGDITGNLNGNASTASKLQTARTITLTGDATGSTSFNGSTNVSIAVDVNTASKLATARTITLTGDASGSASFDGSANISIPVVIANDSHTHATSASSNATTNLTITAGGTTATIADLYATYADQLRTARTISLTGDVTGSTSFNGAGNVSITTTVANNSHTHTFSNITDKPISASWSQGNNNNITTAQFLDLLEEAGAFKYGWFHARGVWSYAATCNITDTGYGTLDLAGSAILVWGVKSYCTILVIPPLNSGTSSTVALGNIYIYVKNGTDYVSGWRKIAKFEDIDWNNIINKPSSFTPSSHTHTLSQISNLNASWDSLLANAPSAYLTRWPSISEVTGKQNLTIRLNGGTTEGTNQFTYNGTAAKTLSITPSNIGAATSSHGHSNYVQKSGDTMTGALTISTSGCPLYIQGGSSAESYLKVRLGGTDKSAFGYNSSLGTFLYSYTYGGYLSLTDSGLARIYKGNSLVGTLWHSGNDGSGSGLNADLLDGYHESSFLRNRTAGNIDFNTITESGIYRLNYTVSNGATNGPSNNEWGQMLVLHGSGDTIAQLSIGYSSGSSIKYRSGNPTDVGGSGSWNSWKTVLDSYNYDSYTVTKTGGGASGTWNINISGTAASANSVAWANVSGKPSSFTPSSHTHTASQVSGLATVATSGSYNDLTNKPTIPTIPSLSVTNSGSGNAVTGITVSGHTITVTKGTISSIDTKNTTGTSNSTQKLYLVGGISQSSTGVVTYSNKAVYTRSGQLYASQMNATNGFFETSDARLKDFKENIKALDTVDQIPTKYFTWKEDESKESQIGTSAQEVEKLYPELVSKTEDNTLTVDYAKLSIIALAAIKELKTEIQSLKEEIKQLKSK